MYSMFSYLLTSLCQKNVIFYSHKCITKATTMRARIIFDTQKVTNAKYNAKRAIRGLASTFSDIPAIHLQKYTHPSWEGVKYTNPNEEEDLPTCQLMEWEIST